MKFVHVSIIEADTAEDATKKAAESSSTDLVWKKTGQIEGDATPERVTDTVNAITLRYKQEKT